VRQSFGLENPEIDHPLFNVCPVSLIQDGHLWFDEPAIQRAEEALYFL
jgi:hypothetical protein